MALIVQKFGGTSVADSQKILSAARKAVRAHQQGNQVVMVVSAMGKNTDLLIDLANEVNESPPAREMDMLLSTGEQVSVALMAMAIESLGQKAISLTGAQIGIRTDSTHTKARIQSISTARLRSLLDDGHIVIAAGFQGIDEDFNITTLGRGGSDTTAVALAAVLRADACEIYTDVDGVYTTDPRALPEARMVRRVSYDEMLELASLGAGVLHSRSVEFAKRFNVPIHVRSSFSDRPGSLIVDEPESALQPVSGAALVKNEARITITGVPDRPGASREIFEACAQRAVVVDMIVQNVGAHGKADVSFTVLENDLRQTQRAVEATVTKLGAEGYNYDADVSKISVVGLGMAHQAGVAARMFRILADEGINILMITTSEIKVSVLVKREQAQAALRAVHRAFSLDTEPAGAPTEEYLLNFTQRPTTDSPLDVVERLQRVQGMEGLTVNDITLDETQARVTVNSVPDEPGVAASVFEAIASRQIGVDMIVQSYCGGGVASLSFTVPREQLDDSIEAVTVVAEKFGCGPVTSSPRVAKLSVSGIGMRSHMGVAVRMFRSLAASEINLDMISTSEVRVNVVVDGAAGQRALASIEQELADVTNR